LLAAVLLLVSGCSLDSNSSHDDLRTADIISDLPAKPLDETSGKPLDVVPDSTTVEGEFLFLTYNVAGLPKEFSDEDPEINNAKISPFLNDFDLVLVQEDFAYHTDLAAAVTLPYQSEPFVVSETMPDGLNRFSVFPFPPVERFAWDVCSGVLDKSNDCLAAKGFSVAPVEISPGIGILVYNLHMDAGGDAEDMAARSAQVDQLLADIAARGAGQAIIVAGDTNLRMKRPEDVVSLDRLLGNAALADTCRFLECDDEHIDRVLFRSGNSLTLTPTSWTIPQNFVDEDGEDLSDHEPVEVWFAWQTP